METTKPKSNHSPKGDVIVFKRPSSFFRDEYYAKMLGKSKDSQRQYSLAYIYRKRDEEKETTTYTAKDFLGNDLHPPTRSLNDLIDELKSLAPSLLQKHIKYEQELVEFGKKYEKEKEQEAEEIQRLAEEIRREELKNIRKQKSGKEDGLSQDRI